LEATPNFAGSGQHEWTSHFQGTAAAVATNRFGWTDEFEGTAGFGDSASLLEPGYDYSVTDYSTLTVSQSISVLYSWGESRGLCPVTHDASQDSGSSALVSMTECVVETSIRIAVYVPIQIMMVYRSATIVQVNLVTITAKPEETSNALLIGLATAGGLIVAILLGAGVFLYRTIMYPDERPLPEDNRGWKRNVMQIDVPPPGQEEEEEELGVVLYAKTGAYETLAAYANADTIEADEIFV
jgi:hypothetical protein